MTKIHTIRVSKREEAMIDRLISLRVGRNPSEVLRIALNFLYRSRTRGEEPI